MNAFSYFVAASLNLLSTQSHFLCPLLLLYVSTRFIRLFLLPFLVLPLLLLLHFLLLAAAGAI